MREYVGLHVYLQVSEIRGMTGNTKSTMSKQRSEKRRRQFQQVLEVAVRLDEFGRSELQAECTDVTTQFLNNVLKQLTASGALALVKAADDTAAARYTWLVDRNTFDVAAWVEQQISGGHQVNQAPREERPRERLLDSGAHNLKTGELIAILIRSGRQGESAVQAGQRVAARFEESLEELPSQSPTELKAISKAVSEVAYCQIMAGVELGRRVADTLQARQPAEKINSTRAAIAYCLRRFNRLATDARQEEFHIVTLDTKLQPIQSHQITVGTLDASLVHPREVFRAAIRDAASAVLLVHNHPSGDVTPSRQDHDVTDRLKQAGELLGINVIDHIIVAKDQAISLSEWT